MEAVVVFLLLALSRYLLIGKQQIEFSSKTLLVEYIFYVTSYAVSCHKERMS